MVDARCRVVRPLHDHAGQHHRERGAAHDPAVAAPAGLGARVGRHGLRAHLRRVHAHRWEARGSLRPAADLRGRARRLHGLVARLRARRRRDRADRGPRRPGARRRADEPGDALDHHRDVPAPTARDGDRDLGGRIRARARDRPARRRNHLRAAQLELDLLHQHPGRHPRRRGRVRIHLRVARHLARAAAGHPGARELRGRPVRPQLRADRGEQLRLDARRGSWSRSQSRPSRSSRSCCSSSTSDCQCSICRCSRTGPSRARTP